MVWELVLQKKQVINIGGNIRAEETWSPECREGDGGMDNRYKVKSLEWVLEEGWWKDPWSEEAILRIQDVEQIFCLSNEVIEIDYK